jgi:ADP-heptose:LPS heptosyltransferase
VNIALLKNIDRIIGSTLVRILPYPSVAGIPKNKTLSILLIRPGGIGDAVLLIPTISILREAYPEAIITVLAERRNSGVFSLSSAVDRILLYDSPGGLLQAILGKYDVVMDSEQWHRLSAIVARISKVPVSIGFDTNERKKLFTHPIPYSHDDYEADSFLHMLAPLGIIKYGEIETPFLVVPDDAIKQANNLLGDMSNKPFVVIFPGASIAERRWGWQRFREVAEKLNSKGTPIVIIGGEEDISDGERIIAGECGLNLSGKTSLAETAAVIDRSLLLISGDSGILHMGVGLGKPTVSLFGPGIAKKWAPRGERHIVLNKCFHCSPCTKFGYTSKCPINARCMTEISVNEVVAAVERLLVANKGYG